MASKSVVIPLGHLPFVCRSAVSFLAGVSQTQRRPHIHAEVSFTKGEDYSYGKRNWKSRVLPALCQLATAQRREDQRVGRADPTPWLRRWDPMAYVHTPILRY